MVTSIKGNATSTFGGNVDVPQIVTDAPMFQAEMSADLTGISHSSFTKVPFDDEIFDTNNNYDTTLYRFTPTVAGYYNFNTVITTSTTPAADSAVYVGLWFNGSRADGREMQASTDSTIAHCGNLSALYYMNGSTDYVEVYMYFPAASGSTITLSSQDWRTVFEGYLVRAV